MKRFPFGFLLALLATVILGLGVGLAYAWIIAPQHLTNSEPAILRADFKDQYRSVIAASYAASGNLPRAQARLALLGDENPVESLNAQAQRMIASGQFTQADQLAALSHALETGGNVPIQFTSTVEIFQPVTTVEPSETPFPSPADLPVILTETLQPTGTLLPLETQVISFTPTPRPTRTLPPTRGAPFTLTGFDMVCDPNLPERLLQVMVFNSKQRQLAGVKFILTWDSGEEEFFTGLKPELGNGYADFVMAPETSYSVQLALGSETAIDLVAPACQAPNGESFTGGYKLTYQQP